MHAFRRINQKTWPQTTLACKLNQGTRTPANTMPFQTKARKIIARDVTEDDGPSKAGALAQGPRQIARLDVGRAGVDLLRRVLGDHADLILCHELLDGLARERTVDVQALRENGWGDKLVLGALGHELLVCVLVEQHQVVGLLLDLTLRPLLLLSAL
jgi:hypothetical protein